MLSTMGESLYDKLPLFFVGFFYFWGVGGVSSDFKRGEGEDGAGMNLYNCYKN